MLCIKRTVECLARHKQRRKGPRDFCLFRESRQEAEVETAALRFFTLRDDAVPAMARSPSEEYFSLEIPVETLRKFSDVG